MKKPIIAVAQIKYYEVHNKDNLPTIKRYIRLAKEKMADIVCFPEICITKKEALTFTHKYVDEIRHECKKNAIWCIVSDEFKIGKKDYNLALLIDRTGKIKGHYEKINLYGENMNPGKRVKVFKTDFANIGIAICWDLAFPDIFQRLKKQGAEIVFCPALWWYESWAYKTNHKLKEVNLLRSLIQARAFENLFYVALSNPVTNAKCQVSYSAIAAPHKILTELVHEEGLITAELNLSKIKKFRKLYPNKKI